MSPSYKAQVDPLLMKQLIQKSNQKGILHFGFFFGPFWIWSSFLSFVGYRACIGRVLVVVGYTGHLKGT